MQPYFLLSFSEGRFCRWALFVLSTSLKNSGSLIRSAILLCCRLQCTRTPIVWRSQNGIIQNAQCKRYSLLFWRSLSMELVLASKCWIDDGDGKPIISIKKERALGNYCAFYLTILHGQFRKRGTGICKRENEFHLVLVVLWCFIKQLGYRPGG